MIRIRSEELKNISSELSGQARETAQIRERLCDVEREISRQSYTEETISRLKALETTLEELQQQITEMSDGLAEVCRITEKTEKNIVDMYEGEKRVWEPVMTGRIRIEFNRFLKENVKIEL